MDAELYRTKEEVESWKKKCPIKRYKKYLLKNNIAIQTEIKDIEKKVKDEIVAASKFAKDSSFPNPEDALRDVYA